MKLSIEEVVKTLIEAIILVVVVMFVFLQTWRATLIPAIAVPVVLLGTFGVLAVFGYTINTLTLFGMVLAIGLLVDDAIVVVENVERVMREQPGISAREATRQSMDEIQTALIAIALVLAAVFLPMAFFGGSVGEIYRQFSITMVSAMVLSVFVALVLSPALAATLLQRPGDELVARRRAHHGDAASLRRPLPSRLRAPGGALPRLGGARASTTAASPPRVYLLLVLMLALVFYVLPKSFLPTEDQGRAQLQYTLPPGATMERTLAVVHEIEQYFLTEEKHERHRPSSRWSARARPAPARMPAAASSPSRPGTSATGRPTARRPSRSAPRKTWARIRDAEFFALNPPPVRGLGQSNGFTMELLNTGGLDRAQFRAARDQLLAAARTDPGLTNVRVNALEDVPTLSVDIDQEKVGALGLAQRDVDATLTAAWAGNYVNDFVDRGRVKRVYVQGDAQFRSRPEDLHDWHVRTASGAMTPFSAFASTSWKQTPVSVGRYNGFSSYEIQGATRRRPQHRRRHGSHGGAGGEDSRRVDRLERAVLPGAAVERAGALSICHLAAGGVPVPRRPVRELVDSRGGAAGGAARVVRRGAGGVAARPGERRVLPGGPADHHGPGRQERHPDRRVRRAEREARAEPAREAALAAARARLRPILMTSLAFIFGVLPLAISTGAGAQSRNAIGTAVVGGMIFGTVLAVFFVPLAFVAVRRYFHEKVGTVPD